MTPLIKRSLLKAQPQEVGKIKIGGRGAQKKTSGGNDMYLPQKFDHFEVTTMERAGGKGPFLRDEAVHAVVGDKPTSLDAMLMFPEIEQNLMTSMREYAGRKAKVVCDGEVRKEGMVEGPCKQLDGGVCNCRPYIRLPLQLMASPHTGGYYVFRSRGWGTTNNIQTFMEETYGRFGTLFHAPVKLICFHSEDQYQQDGQDRVGKSLKVAMVLNLPYEQAALHMIGQKELLESVRERLMLTAGEVVQSLDNRDEEEEAEIADEFDPPKGLEASVATQGRLDAVVDSLKPVDDPERDSAIPEADYEVEEDDKPKESPNATILRELRGEARELSLLDAAAEQFIADSLESGDEKQIETAMKALNRRFVQAEKEE